MLRFKSEQDYERWRKRYGVKVEDVSTVVSLYGAEADIRAKTVERRRDLWPVEWVVLGIVLSGCVVVWMVW